MPSYHSSSSCARCGSRKRLDPDAPARAISARNATSHGLFARDVVLPHLGENPDAYNALLSELLAQIKPTNILERHYVEKIAAATWRLRRLHRWQAQLFEDPNLDEGERLDKLDKVLRHETGLHRQIDAAVKMLNKDVTQLFAGRARTRALADWQTTPQECKEVPAAAKQVEYQTRQHLVFRPFPGDDFDMTVFDTQAAPKPEPSIPTDHPTPDAHTQNCQNEPASYSEIASHNDPPAQDTTAQEGQPITPAAEDTQNCQNEPHPAARARHTGHNPTPVHRGATSDQRGSDQRSGEIQPR